MEGDGHDLQAFLGKFEETPKNLSEEGWSSGRQLNWGLPKYEAGLLTTLISALDLKFVHQLSLYKFSDQNLCFIKLVI
jgi:hypothetical protein